MRRLLQLLFGFETPVSRRLYATVGLGLGVAKYGVDALTIWSVTGTWWQPLRLLSPLHDSTDAALLTYEPWLFWALALWTLPFLWIGASMTMRRARDAGWSGWLGLAFFFPFFNYALMLALCAAPSAPPKSEASAQVEPLVGDGFKAAFAGVAGGLVFALVMMGFTVYVLHAYPAALFFGTPVVMGAVSGYVQNRGHTRSVNVTLQVACLSVLISAGALLLFALEGVFCIVLALPIAAGAAMFGAWMGRALALGPTGSKSQLAMVLLAVPVAAGLEKLPAPLPEYEVASSVDIDASPERVWSSVIAFPPLAAPSEWLFKTGIAFPTQARIDGAGVGAVRHCEFSTGEFVEPVTRWEPGRRLSFAVTSQPEPMEEWSPYRHLHPPHLDGYFRSVRGEFRLVPLGPNRTRLEGSTWYVLDIAPVGYWRLGAEAIVHAIHARVLRHIKTLSES